MSCRPHAQKTTNQPNRNSRRQQKSFAWSLQVRLHQSPLSHHQGSWERWAYRRQCLVLSCADYRVFVHVFSLFFFFFFFFAKCLRWNVNGNQFEGNLLELWLLLCRLGNEEGTSTCHRVRNTADYFISQASHGLNCMVWST